MPVAVLKECITWSEFLEWLEYIREEDRHPSKLDQYLAQVAMEVCRGRLENPRSVKLSDFILKTKEEKEEQDRKQAVEDSSREERIKKSKSAWLNLVGLAEGN
jgi:hypothetical protein